MSRDLRTYKITLTVNGPLYIGSGKEIGKKEYIFLSNNELGIMDIGKLYAKLLKKGLAPEFEKYMLQEDRRSLEQWLSTHRFQKSDVQECLKYKVKYGKLSVERGKRLEVREFVKDPYGMPYIPGSSLKGMLRTLFLATDIIRNPQKYQRDKEAFSKDLASYSSNGKYPAKGMRNIEAKRFNLLTRDEKEMHSAVNDIMSGMVVSDSYPLSTADLVLCQRIERKVDGTEKKLNVLRECIKPGSKISFDLTIDESLCAVNAGSIKDAVREFAGMYNDCFVCKFRGTDRIRDNMVCLGGGVGFLSKTVIYPMYGEKEGVRKTQEIFDKTKVPRMHKHFQDIKLGVSPHIMKCAEYNGKSIPMGICTIEIR